MWLPPGQGTGKGERATVVATSAAQGTVSVRTSAGKVVEVAVDRLEPFRPHSQARLQGNNERANADGARHFGAQGAALWTDAPAERRLTLSIKNDLNGLPVTAMIKQPRLDAQGQTVMHDGRPALSKVATPAVLLGHDPTGRAVVEATIDGATRRYFMGFRDVQATLPAGTTSAEFDAACDPAKLLLRGIDLRHVTTPSPRALEALKLALKRKVVGDHTAQEFADALMKAGHPVMLVGGAIRDVIDALDSDPNTPMDVLLDCFKDVDFVTTALPSEIRDICKKISPEEPEGGVWTPPSIDRFAVVGVGTRKSGIDIASFRVGYSGPKGSVLGHTILDDASGRDFTVNQLCLVLGSNQIVDPTGQGLADTRAKVLRANLRDMDQNELLSLRYFKFRVRGYTGDAATKAAMREHALTALAAMVDKREGQRFVTNFLRIVPGGCVDRAALDAYVLELKRVMTEDGMGDVFARFFTPARIDAIEKELAARAVQGAA